MSNSNTYLLLCRKFTCFSHAFRILRDIFLHTGDIQNRHSAVAVNIGKVKMQIGTAEQFNRHPLNQRCVLNIDKYDLWFAHWARSCGYTGSNLGMWQYGGETNLIDGNSVPGVGVIDKNLCYRDYPTVIKAGGFNAYVRQLKRKLTLMRIEESDMQQFEKEQEQCAAVIREAVSNYREQQKPIDDELNELVQENRQKMKAVTDEITEKYFG